jgi:molybdopterin converting factor small subunit
MPHVVFPSSLAAATGGSRRVHVAADDVASLVQELRARYPELERWLDNGAGSLPDYTNMFVNDLDVRPHDDAPIALAGDDEVLIIVEMSGG